MLGSAIRATSACVPRLIQVTPREIPEDSAGRIGLAKFAAGKTARLRPSRMTASKTLHGALLAFERALLGWQSGPQSSGIPLKSNSPSLGLPTLPDVEFCLLDEQQHQCSEVLSPTDLRRRCYFSDYDNDGKMDIFFTNGANYRSGKDGPFLLQLPAPQQRGRHL